MKKRMKTRGRKKVNRGKFVGLGALILILFLSCLAYSHLIIQSKKVVNTKANLAVRISPAQSKDLVNITKDFGKTKGYNRHSDLNRDGRIDIKDLLIAAQNLENKTITKKAVPIEGGK